MNGYNQRVKGTEKFWTQDGAEAVLQIRAAYLREDNRAEQFHEQRPGRRPESPKTRRINGHAPQELTQLG